LHGVVGFDIKGLYHTFFVLLFFSPLASCSIRSDTHTHPKHPPNPPLTAIHTPQLPTYLTILKLVFSETCFLLLLVLFYGARVADVVYDANSARSAPPMLSFARSR
jgi:hypothetical protein